MNLFQTIMFAVVAAMLVMAIREMAPQVSFYLSLFVAAILFLAVMQRVIGLLVPIERLAEAANVNVVFFATVLKIIGIAYVAEFGAQIARDAGVVGIAGKIELLGKLSIIVLAVPIITAVVDTMTHLLP
jgi:stage III sporulation protein AD